MKTFQEFLEILQEKKKKPSEKKLVKGIVVRPKKAQRFEDGTLYYNLNDQPSPVDTKPGSPERRVQTKEIESHGAKQFKKEK